MAIESNELWQEPLRRIFAHVIGAPPERLDPIPMKGGLESAVVRVRIEFTAPSGKRACRSVVVKRLDAEHRREAAIHRVLGSVEAAPDLLGTVETSRSTYLVLEFVRPHVRWPWRTTDHTREAMKQLARIHALEPEEADLPAWDYERELREGAALTVRTAEEHVAAVPEIPLRTNLRPLARFAERMPAVRRNVADSFGRTFVHGDAHPGNAILRMRGGKANTVFIDWARSRFASPLEDVSSWLQTLRYWEPSAARRHDTLLRDYLTARQNGLTLTRELRDAYWVSAASNAMAGALRFQIVQAGQSTGRERRKAADQAREWLRVIRRADACTGA